MKTAANFGIRCAAIIIVMAMVISILPLNSITSTVTADVPKGPAAVDLGTAGNFVVLAKTGISTTGTTKITGNIGISPADHTYLTGFSETMDVTNTFSTSDYVVGKLYAADYTDPTPAKMTTAISDMETAYTDAAGRKIPDATELGAGDISAMTLAPGLYKWGTDLNIDLRGVTLAGGANDVWIFQIAGDFIVADTAIVTLSGGAQASNIFWQVGGVTGATLGTTSVVNGNILSAKAIIMTTGATLNGRALAQSAVTIDANPVTVPSGLSSNVDPISPYWQNTSPLNITASASTNSNSVKLYYRYSVDNLTWGTWNWFGNATAAPWNWSFGFPNGTGHYQFYSQAFVNATVFETAPGLFDQICGYDNIKPSSSVNAMAPFWNNLSPLTLTATASDATSGVKNISLYYRYAADNVTWGAWTLFSNVTAAPWSWIFNFPNGTGNYQVYTRAHDNATNFEAAPATADLRYGYDLIAPTSSANAIALYWKNASPKIVTATATDANSGVKDVTLYYKYSADNATWGAWTSFGVDNAAPWSWSFTFLSGNGYYQFYTIASDNATNFETAPGVADRIAGYDTTAPTSSVSTIVTYWKTASPLVVTATSADALSGVKNVTLYYKYSADNATWGAWTSFGVDNAAPWSWSFTFTNGSGYYQFCSRANDYATNFEASPVVADQIAGYDITAPTSNVNAIATYWKTISPLTVTATATDSLSGINDVTLYYRYSPDNTTWGAWTSVGSDLAAPWSWNFPFTTGNGYYEFYSRAHDKMTNFEAAPGLADQIVGFDNTAPTSNANAITSFWKNTSPITVTATSVDVTSGVKSIAFYYRYSVDNTTWNMWTLFGTDLTAPWSISFTAPNGNGYYQVYTIATDMAGNFEAAPAVADQAFGYDVAAPTSNVNAITYYWKNTSPMTVTASAADTPSGVKSVALFYRYSTDNTTWTAWTSFGVEPAASMSWGFTFMNGNGYYQFYTLATDTAGNIEAAPAVADRICGYDLISPTSSVDVIAPYWKNINPMTVTATAANSISGVRDVTLYFRYSADNTTWGAWRSFGADNAVPWSWSFTAPNGNGYYQFYTIGSDRAGNIEVAPSIADVKYAYDNEKPVIGADTTPITATTGRTLTFNIAITDNFGVTAAKVVYRLGSGAWVNQTLTKSGTYQYALAISPISTQSVQYYVFAADSAGNWRISQTKTVIVHQATLPTLTIVGPTNGLLTKDTRMTVYGTAGATMATIAKIEWALNNATWTPCTGTTAWSCDVPLAAGSNKVTVRATDSSGNKAFKDVMLNLDQTMPTLTITNLVDKSTVKKTSLPMSGTAFDANGIVKVEVQVNGGIWNTATGTTAWTYPATLKSGTNTINVKATDTAGNTATQTRTIQSKKPSSTFVWPPYTIAVVLIIAAAAVGVYLLLRKPSTPSGKTASNKKTDAQAKGAKKGKEKAPES